MKSSCLALLLFAGTSAFAADTVYESPVPPGGNPAVVASPRNDWYRDVQQKFTRFQNKHADIVFDGDSITNRWEGTGKSVWDPHYAAISADFGIEGDRVENVLWRLSKGQVDGVDPKVVVLMIGTNNSGRDSAEQIAEGIKALVPEYEKRCPHAHIILMGIFPRGQSPNDGGRKKVAAVNAIISSLDDGDRVSYVDIGPQLIESDGTISPTMMPDFVHPTAKGYQIWSDAIQPIIDKYVAPAPASPAAAAPPSPPSTDDKGTPAKSALITFSGLYNASHTVSGTPLHQELIPASYQPLINLYPETKPVDGANLSTSITWNGVSTSNRAANPGVQDHTGDSDPADGTLGGGVAFGTAPFSMTFSHPVEIPSFFWTYYGTPANMTKAGSIAVYAKADDATPVKSVDLNYADDKGYVWHEMTDFAGMSVSKIAFDPGTLPSGSAALNIDDMTVRLKDAVPANP